MSHDRSTHGLSRRDLLRLSGAVGAGALLASSVSGQVQGGQSVAATAGAARKRAVRLAHLTDIHVQPERGAGDGLAQCLTHLQAQADKPSLIVTGGDLVMDSFDADDARTKLQWELFTKTFRDHCSLPTHHTLGNHDIWGWNKKKSKTGGDEKQWGKQRAQDVLGLAGRFHSHDVGGWHIIHLDSTQHHPDNPDGYMAFIDDEQLAWLEKDLASVKPGTHTLVVSHIPILSVTVILDKPEKDHNFKVSGAEMHTDSQALRSLFEKNGSVRACLSGHIHRLDRIEFRGIRYFCNGAVSGSWWKGPQAEAFEGYTLVDLYDDGTVECQYTSYGWKART